MYLSPEILFWGRAKIYGSFKETLRSGLVEASPKINN